MSSQILNSLLNRQGCYCLNEENSSPHTNLFLDDGSPLRSDADAQLLLHLDFNQIVKLQSIEIGVPNDDTCPKSIKLFANSDSMGFSDAEEIQETQFIELSNLAPKIKINLNAAKWSRVTSLTMYVVDNHGGSISSFHSMNLIGIPIMSTDLSKGMPKPSG